ncbi:CHR family transporter: chromate ion [Coccomyxa subellipsoidea C-169]|uniref:CHR family transporter: chromate ion n=1 Tax=Coccomyxa subellipsoidea (strain C-169) TaxID=574566 RepID=I0YQH8_COCSC|nr:CHR family transporter: chromate ion [Coccomyxa subellipsoidea C-169]EIE20647.1 CHR family transporter: chromate ion [Coccomyxa subellipsoidea C-169]|eukprot:XP_005645191.1 CHR family transporter: chromate ion [Coccomyxa subellipsoidea C-169]
MGWVAFGGPTAHIALFQKVFVEKLKWLSSTVFLELLGLSQCLPGPTSTQVSFAIGVVHKGVTGGLMTGVLFQYPGFLIASLVGAGAANFLKNPAPWLEGIVAGLAAVGVALVASAAKGLTYGTCKDRTTMIINAVAAIISYYFPATWIFPTLILAGGVVTLFTLRKRLLWGGDFETNFTVEQVSKASAADRIEKLGVSRAVGLVLIAAWAIVLVLTIVFRRRTDYAERKELYWWEAFYRTGSIIFGGGQVVLPLLQNEVVATGWVSQADFLTGLALVQAMPGPLFNFAAYLGAVIAYNAGVSVVAGIFICWVALFAPGILLIYGFMPWWGGFRHFQVYRRMLPGLNSAAVGLIVASVFSLTFQIYAASPFPNTTICIGIIGFALVDFVGCPAPLAVLIGGVCGVIGWAAHMH